MKQLLLFICACTIVFCVACVRNETPDGNSQDSDSEVMTEEEKTIEEFNSRSYGFCLCYSDGEYSLKPDTLITCNTIVNALAGHTVLDLRQKVVTPNGFALGSLIGGGRSYYSFSESIAHLLFDPNDPSETNFESDEPVSFADNLIFLGTENLTVYSVLEDGEVDYFVKSAMLDTTWYCGRLIPRNYPEER